MRDATQPNSIVGRYEISEIFGVTRQAVASIIDHAEFPAPICRQGKHRAPLFWRRDVERFKAERERQAAAESSAAA